MTNVKQVNLLEIAEKLGLRICNRNKTSCFQCGSGSSRKGTPALHLYSDHFHCFSCGAHGDAADLVQAVTGCSFPDAYQVITGERLPQARVGECRPDEIPLDVPIGSRIEYIPESNLVVEIPVTKRVVGLKNAVRLAQEIAGREIQEELTNALRDAFERSGNPVFFEILRKWFPIPLYQRKHKRTGAMKRSSARSSRLIEPAPATQAGLAPCGGKPEADPPRVAAAWM